VYEQEASLFFKDLSSTVIPDDVIHAPRLFPNLIVTGHQAFFTTARPWERFWTRRSKHLGFCRGPPAGQRDRRTCMSANASRWATWWRLAGWRR